MIEVNRSLLPTAVAGRRRTQSPSAVTMLELLFCIAIVSVLLTFLLSAHRAGRESANDIKCVSNLRRLGQAVFSYANDNNGNLLPCLLQNYHDTWTAGDLSLPWCRILMGPPNYLAPDVYPPSDVKQATGTSVFDCPSRKGMPDYKPAYYDHPHYGYNYFPGFDNRSITVIHPGEVAEVKSTVRKLNAIERPSKTMLLGEISKDYTLYPQYPDLCVTPHRAAMNAFYADGSIQRVTRAMLSGTTGDSTKLPFY